jgi:zinc transporter ZupT
LTPPGWFDEPTLWVALAASLVAGLATGAGALPVLFVRPLSPRVEGALLGFSAGVMLAASFFSLLMPSLEALSAAHGQAWGAVRSCGALLLGAATLSLLHQIAPTRAERARSCGEIRSARACRGRPSRGFAPAGGERKRGT